MNPVQFSSLFDENEEFVMEFRAVNSVCYLYCYIYAIYKSINLITNDILAKIYIQLVVYHWHKILFLPVEISISPHKKAEVLIFKL